MNAVIWWTLGAVLFVVLAGELARRGLDGALCGVTVAGLVVLMGVCFLAGWQA